jgi:hypothetical protein
MTNCSTGNCNIYGNITISSSFANLLYLSLIMPYRHTYTRYNICTHIIIDREVIVTFDINILNDGSENIHPRIINASIQQTN